MQFALLISVLIALLLSAFLLLTHVQSFFRIKSGELIEATETATLQILKSLGENNISQDTLVVKESDQTKKMIANYHGVWTKVFSEITIRNQKITKTAFIGSALQEKSPNLYLANTNSPLVVVGNTRLEGNSYLPKQGVKAGNISGHYYQGSGLYYGNVFQSKETLPKLDDHWISYITSLTEGILIREKNSIALAGDLKNSFNKPYKTVYSPSSIVLGDEKIAGNIIIQSDTKIVVHPTTLLENTLLVAPHIIINDGVKGNIQIIASKKIEIGKNCHLSYPSSVTLFDQTKTPKMSNSSSLQNREINFVIGKNTLIEGSVIYLPIQTKKQDRIKTNLKIEPGTEIIGEIYCQGNIEFEGTIRGSLYTKQCIANQSGSIYLNHIYNGKVLINPIPDYAGLPFVNSKNKIAKWLY